MQNDNNYTLAINTNIVYTQRPYVVQDAGCHPGNMGEDWLTGLNAKQYESEPLGMYIKSHSKGRLSFGESIAKQLILATSTFHNHHGQIEVRIK